MSINEILNQNSQTLQHIVEKAVPVLNKAFPKEEVSLAINKLHPCNVEEALIPIFQFIERLPENLEDLEKIIPSADFDRLCTALSSAGNHLEELRQKIISFYGESFEHTPLREGFRFTAADGRAEEVRGQFQIFTTELEHIKESIRNIGPWVSKQKIDPLSESVKHLKKERDAYKSAFADLLRMQEDHKQKVGILPKLLQEIEQYKKLIHDASENASKALGQLNQHGTNANTAIEGINTQKKNLEELLLQEASIKEKIDTAVKELDGFEEKLAEQRSDAEGYATQSTELMGILQQNLIELESARKKANEIIATATSATLAGAYTKEANLRAKSSTFYFWCVLVSLAVISLIGVVLIFKHHDSLTLLDYLPRVLLMLPLSFVAVVANTQLAANRQVREEYAHKASLSLSFEGYRRLIEDHKQEQIKYFEDTVAELRKNPADRLGKSENEIDTIRKLAKVLSKCPDLFKMMGENIPKPTGTTTVAHNENNNPRRRSSDNVVPIDQSTQVA